MSIETLPLTSLGAAAAAVVENARPRIIHHEPGVYFGLPDEDYFRDPALGSTDLKRLLISPADYWGQSLYNPARKPDSTRYKDRGHALHAHVLFGLDEFHARFARKVQKDDFPDLLVTTADLKRALVSLNMATTGKKEDLISRLRNSTDRFVIFDEEVARQESSGKTILDPEDYDRVVIASAMIKRNPHLEHCFENGAPEVSVFWEVDGVRFRVRFDYLRDQSIVDLKSFTNSMDRPIREAIKMTFWNRRHDIQANHYLNGRGAMRRLIREGRVFGDIDQGWVRRLADIDDYLFVFVYHTLSGSTVTRGITIRPGQHIDGAAGADVARAVQIYRRNREIFGEEMWVDMTPLHEFTQEDEPVWVRSSAGPDAD